MKLGIGVRRRKNGLLEKRFTVEGKRYSVYGYTIEEQRLFFCCSKDNYYYELFVLMIRTGLRLGEAGALYWSDIDYELNVIHVRRTITRDKKGIFKIGDNTKSEAGNRDIPMNEGIRSILELQKNKSTGNLVFNSKHGCMISHSTVNREIRNICNSAGIEVITSHAFRDTFATRFIEQGGNPQTLKVILGHSSLSMTMDLYSHVLPNTKQEEMDKVKIDI